MYKTERATVYYDETHTLRSREGPTAIVTRKTCQDIKDIARAVLDAKGKPSPARGTLLQRRANTLLKSSPPTTKKLPERSRLRRIIKNIWKERWTAQTSQARRSKPVAQDTQWNPKLRHLHHGLSKPQSTITTLLCTENIGLEDFLFRRRVPGHPSPACPCGWHR